MPLRGPARAATPCSSHRRAGPVSGWSRTRAAVGPPRSWPRCPGPPTVSEDNLRRTFGEGWRITRLVPAHYATTVPGQALPDAPGKRLDGQGRLPMPVWHLTAVRA
ncbi:hypothetical protein GCM10023214_32650 [Amycolatopsis dongchuanensis]|uniref:Uncharacterized protein n=1 Tax=Amycolatopsis dongchuanensis TaxID=1070866 RepID=A0ABP9QLF0_9PSEU